MSYKFDQMYCFEIIKNMFISCLILLANKLNGDIHKRHIYIKCYKNRTEMWRVLWNHMYTCVLKKKAQNVILRSVRIDAHFVVPGLGLTLLTQEYLILQIKFANKEPLMIMGQPGV